jgi:chaperonin GroES
MTINANKLKPLNDRVLIKRKTETESQGGIILTESAQEKQQQGTVIAVGPGKFTNDGKLQEMQVKTGDTVFFAKYSGVEFEFDNEEFIVMREDDIVAVTE